MLRAPLGYCACARLGYFIGPVPPGKFSLIQVNVSPFCSHMLPHTPSLQVAPPDGMVVQKCQFASFWALEFDPTSTHQMGSF